MESLFLSVYYGFQKNRKAFWTFFVALIVILGFTASRIKIEEDITRFFPDDERVEKLNYVFQNAKFAERIVFMVSVRDSSTLPQPDSLVAFTEEIVQTLGIDFQPYVKSITSQIDDTKLTELISTVQGNLPIFLEESDYSAIAAMIEKDSVKRILENSYRQLISPSGIVTKNIIVKDPLGISYLVLKRLQQLQYDENIEVYNNYLISKDHRHLIFFVEPNFKPSDTGKNTPFIISLDEKLQRLSETHPQLQASYFGATSVAVGNARQLQRDTTLTLSLMVVLLAIFLIGFFRKKRIPFLILIPVLFGGLFSLTFVYLIQGSISVIAIAAGSIILGIAINYSLHFLTHLRHVLDVPQTIRDLVKPMTLGSATTVLAFLCLQFVNASVLRDVGLFAAFSLIGAALSSLIILPQLISTSLLQASSSNASWIERVAHHEFKSKKFVLLAILVLTPLFLYFANDVQFNSDLSEMNFMKPEVRQSQERLETINKASLTAVYVISQGKTLEQALQKNEISTSTLQSLQAKGDVQKFSSVSSFIISDSVQKMRIKRWNEFWTSAKQEELFKLVREEGIRLKFSETVFNNFETLLRTNYQPADSNTWSIFRRSFFDDFIIERDEMATVITLANVDPEKKESVYHALADSPSNAFDRLKLTNLFVEFVHADFNFIVTFTSILVFFALLVSYGRIELTLITFLPMLITWIWILGIMGLVGIEFNIVNVMISTFIFGLGDDYSIFTMDGLQQEYSVGKKNLSSIRTSILLSALTTISGLGVLIFAEHPALRSIAGISIIGIVCVFVMSQTIQPFLFRWLITNRTQRGKAPMTFLGIFRTTLLYSLFVVGSIVLTIIGLIFKIVPFSRKKLKFTFHALIRAYTQALIFLAPSVSITTIGKTGQSFSSPTIIISNHSSFLDILLTVMQDPRLILLTNKWVWDSPIFGGVVRLADYYPVTEGAEESIDKLKTQTNNGYSVVVFPEGTRTTDGKLKRFHKGAFFLSESLNVPIQPLLIIGAGDCVPKNDLYINPTSIILKYLPIIDPADSRYGNGYAERTKSISKYFRSEYQNLDKSHATPDNVVHRVISNYLYKGPVLEWYMRIKIRMEKNYESFHTLIPAEAKILDLGCGYGFLCHMLALLSSRRDVTGIDYDEEKIAVASHGYLNLERVRFSHGDITKVNVDGYDVIIIADVLHYLTTTEQDRVLIKCFEALKVGGKLIIRDGNADLQERHKGTRITEFFSVKLLGFNKSVNQLHFLSGKRLIEMASSHGLNVTVVDETKLTSNVIFVISRFE